MKMDGGESGIRTHEGAFTPYSISNRAPSTTRPPLPARWKNHNSTENRVKTPLRLLFSTHSGKDLKNDQDIICLVFDSAVCPVFKKNGLPGAKFITAFLTDYKGLPFENQQS